MGKAQRKVERRARKRRQRRQAISRMTASHERRLESDVHPVHACLVNRHWREDGKASIHLARRVAPGRVTMAAFLVDTWAMGLKDAFGRVDIACSEFDEQMADLDEQLGITRLDIGTARHLVYGGIDLAGELGFRLPRRYERWTAILGPLPEGEPPDMSLFRPDGRIRLWCSMKDLEARLIGSTPEKFLAREDVDYTLGDDDFTLVDEEDDDVDDMLTMLEDAMLDRVKAWCFAHGQTPHPLLRDVVGATLQTTVEAIPPDFDPEDDVCALPDEPSPAAAARMLSFLHASVPDDPAGLEAAMTQFDGFMQDMGSPQELIETLGLEGEE